MCGRRERKVAEVMDWSWAQSRDSQLKCHAIVPPEHAQVGSTKTLAYDASKPSKEPCLLELTKDSIPKTLGVMALLTSVGMLALVGFGVADAIFVGMLGEVPLAALTYAFPSSSAPVLSASG